MIGWHAPLILVCAMVSVLTIATAAFRFLPFTFEIGSSARQPATVNVDARTLAMWNEFLPVVRDHSAPTSSLSIAAAHREMQLHAECRVQYCARKAAAFRVLVRAGRIKPDSNRTPRPRHDGSQSR